MHWRPYLPESQMPDETREAQKYDSTEEFEDESLEAMRIKIVELIDFMYESDLTYGEAARLIMDNVVVNALRG